MLNFLERSARSTKHLFRKRAKHHRRRKSRLSLVEFLEDRRLLAALRVASYNVLQGSPSNSTEEGFYSTILEAIGNETKAGISRPIDLLVLQETNSNSINRLENILDALYADDYALHLSPGYAGLHYGFVYNTETLQLLGTQNISGSFTRPPLRGHFNPIDATLGDADFYVYSTHLKAGSSASDESTRTQEAAALRTNADALGEGENVLIVGDFNMKDSFEGAYTNLTASGAGQVHDPINRPGNWFNNNQFRDIHTQDPSGGGGMDDRFDLQFISGELQVSGGLDYIPGTYRAFGNNGTHALNGVLTGSGAAPNVLAALRSASDHLPVIVDYEFQSVPAGITIAETDGNTIVAENSYLDSYSVVLDTIPDFDVTVTLTPDAEVDLGMGAGVATQLTFTPLNALTPQTISVATPDDAVAEGNEIKPITHSFSSVDTQYNTLSNIDLDVVIVDDETPTILINEVDAFTIGSPNVLEFIELYDGGIGNTSLTGKSLVLFDGGTDSSYAAFDLDGFTTDDNGLFVIGNVGVPGVDLTFVGGLLRDGADAVAIYDDDATSFPNGTSVTTTNLVDALVYDTDDADDVGLLALLQSGESQINENSNGNALEQSLSRLPDGGEARRTGSYSATTPTPNALNVPRTPGFSILGTDGLAVSEAGQTDQYTIALTSVPTSNVLVTLDPDSDLDLGGGAGVPVVLTFTPANAMNPQTVSVAAFDDTIADGLHIGIIQQSVSSGDTNYQGFSLDDVTVSITDNEPPPPVSVVISEIMYNPASSGEGTAFSPEWVEIVNTATAPQDISGWKLTDEDGNWGVVPPGTTLQSQQVAVLFDGAPTSITTEAGFRSTWGIPTGALVVGVDWQDLANDPSATNEILELKDEFDVVRDTVNYDDEGTWPTDSPEGPSIYLTDILSDNNVGSNWARSALGVDDGVSANGFPFSTSDIGSPGNVPAFVLGSLILAESGGTTAVTEGGAGDDFTIVLDSVPSQDVVVTLTPDAQVDLGAGPGNLITRTFTTATALTPITINVSALDDMVAEGVHTGLITVTTSSLDAAFDGLVVSDVNVDVTDNDIAGVTVTESGGSTDVTEGGATDDLTIVLDTIPTDSVTVTLTPDAQLDLGSGAGVALNLLFTTTDALTPQNVTVVAEDDAVIEGLHSGQISISVSSLDTNYDSLSVSDITASITDNDSAVSLQFEGEAIAYTGPGTYTFEYFVTATGGDQIIKGFQLPFAFDIPGVTFSGLATDFTPDAGFDLEVVSPLPAPSDFGLGGIAAFSAGLTALDGQRTSLFTIDLTVAAVNGLLPGANEVGVVVETGPVELRDESNNLITSLSFGTGLTLTQDSVAPTITDVIVAGSAWAPGFVSRIGSNGLGLSLPGTDQLVNLTYANLDRIYIQFSEDIGSFTAADVELTGVNTATYTPTVTYNPSTFLATLSLATPVAADKLEISIADSLTDLAGNALDGEWTDSVSPTSGNGTAGGNFDFRIDVLPGDFDDSDDVSIGDVISLSGLVFSTDLRADLDGSDDVSVGDVILGSGLVFTNLPSGSPALVASESLIRPLTVATNKRDEDEDGGDAWSSLVDEVFTEEPTAVRKPALTI